MVSEVRQKRAETLRNCLIHLYNEACAAGLVHLAEELRGAVATADSYSREGGKWQRRNSAQRRPQPSVVPATSGRRVSTIKEPTVVPHGRETAQEAAILPFKK